MAQEKENHGKGAKEMNKAADQEKQKGTEKVKEAEEAAEAEAEKVEEAAETEADKVKDTAEKVKKDKELKQNKENEGDKGQGHAYGKNKGDLQGRDFGQARAEQARMQQQAREADLDSQIEKGDQKVAQSRERIRVAREELEKEKAGRRISEKDYQLKKEKIDNAEKAVDEYEQKVNSGRGLKGEK